MNSLFRKIFTFSMALVIFMSGLGMAVSKHYCSSQLRDMKFFQKADSCMVLPSQGCNQNEGINKEPCCKSEHLYYVDGTDKVNFSFDIQLKWDFDFHYFSIFQEEILNISECTSLFVDLPLMTKPIGHYDLQVLNQSFLI